MDYTESRVYEGGYYFLSEDLIRAGIHGHTRELDKPISEETLAALNAVQRTPWRVNGWMLDVIRQAYESNAKLGDLPFVDLVAIPRKDDEEWEAMSEEDKGRWKRELSEIHGINARMEGRRHSFLHKLDIARELRDREAIWFPHFLDFRGRFYPMAQDLHPQSDDIGRSMLSFAEGKPLGDRGLFWLGIRLANTFGNDKIALADRYKWALDNSELIFDSADNPLDGERFWAEADEPWTFLATCREWSQAMIGGPSYRSTLPINVDASCNGLQHLSALARDPVGAKATNLAANDVRQDIYVEVANVVKALVSEDAVNAVELAQEWVGKVDRKVVKRAVMTTPYGVTPIGIADQLVKDGFTRGMSSSVAAAHYLRDHIVAALGETVVSAKQIMGWVQDVAVALSKSGVPFRFTTPTGNTIQQSYYTLAQKRIATLLGTLAIWEEDRIGGLNDRKQMLAAAPNLIHAFDASHQTKTVNAMVAETERVSFSMIHDSYGTHAAEMDRLGRVLREQFVGIYRTNWLERIEAEVRSYAPEVDIPSYTKRVTTGDFDIEQVLRSEFFFA
jgi:DNA-directed RNA polymerase